MAVPGVDYLAGGKYPNAVLKVHPDGWAAGFILDVDGFGSTLPVIEKLCSQKKPSSVRIHGIWRDNHDFNNPKLWALAAERAKAVNALALKFPSVQFFYSPYLEHRMTGSTLQKAYVTVLRELLPQVKYVNCYISGGSALSTEINEVHGNTPGKPRGAKGYFVSLDGTSCANVDMESWKKRYSDAWIQFVWDFRNNGRAGEKDKTKRPSRKHYADEKYLTSQIRLMKPKGVAPKFGVKSTPFKKPSLVKTHAEDGVTMPQSRANRLLLILPKKLGDVSLITSNGKVVDRLTYYAPYKNSYRYYSSKYGFEVGLAALSASGSEFVVAKLGNEYFGPFNPSFREGYFD